MPEPEFGDPWDQMVADGVPRESVAEVVEYLEAAGSGAVFYEDRDLTGLCFYNLGVGPCSAYPCTDEPVCITGGPFPEVDRLLGVMANAIGFAMEADDPTVWIDRQDASVVRLEDIDPDRLQRIRYAARRALASMVGDGTIVIPARARCPECDGESARDTRDSGTPGDNGEVVACTNPWHREDAPDA